MGREINFAKLWRSSEPMMSLRDPRYSVFLYATVKSGDGIASAARIRNISCGGVMAECRFRGKDGDRVEIAVRGHGDLSGTVAWARRDRIGVMFDEPIDLEAILRRPVADQPEITVPRPPTKAWRPALHCA
jgi:hypothetical protein